MDNNLLTIEEVADRLKVHPNTARHFLTGTGIKEFGKMTIEVVRMSKRTVRYILNISGQ